MFILFVASEEAFSLKRSFADAERKSKLFWSGGPKMKFKSAICHFRTKASVSADVRIGICSEEVVLLSRGLSQVRSKFKGF